MLASAGRLRSRVVPRPSPTGPDAVAGAVQVGARCGWRRWAELMQRVFQLDLARCLRCGAPMKLRALVTEPANLRRTLRHLDEATDLPPRSPARDPFRSLPVRDRVETGNEAHRRPATSDESAGRGTRSIRSHAPPTRAHRAQRTDFAMRSAIPCTAAALAVGPRTISMSTESLMKRA